MSRPRKSFYLLIPLLASLFGVLLLELGLALFYPIPFSLEKNMYFESDPYTGFRNKPYGSGFFPTGIDAVANSRGHRDDEVELAKPAGVFRILALGDSFTVGANVEQEEVYAQVLEVLLNEGAAQPVEVVNSGTGGWSPFQYAQYYEYYGQEFEPDLVIVGFFAGNDTYVERNSVEQTRAAVLGRRLPREMGFGWDVYVRVALYENSHIARALMSGVPDQMNFNRQQCDEFNEYFLAVQANRLHNHVAVPSAEALQTLDANVEHIARIRDLAAANGTRLLVMIFPDETQVNPDLQAQLVAPGEASNYDFDNPQPLLRQRFAAMKIDYLDLLEEIRADARCLYMNDTHWNPAGHRFVAERIREYLLENEAL